MVASVYTITNIPDAFSLGSQGYWQGDMQADPAGKFQITTGQIAISETLPMFGGLAVYAATPPVTATVPPAGVTTNAFMGPIIGRAINNAQIAGFAINNGSASSITSPQQIVPLAVAGGSQNWVRRRTQNRVVVACSALLTNLAGSFNPQMVSWDITNNVLIPYAPLGTSLIQISSLSWTNGVLTVGADTSTLTGQTYITIQGIVPYGYNISGTFTIIDGQHLQINCPVYPGAVVSISGTGAGITTGLGGFEASIIDIDTNSAVVAYNSTQGYYWSVGGVISAPNFTPSTVYAAVIQI